MASEGDTGEIKEHVESYSLFSALMKWGAIISIALTGIVILIIAN